MKHAAMRLITALWLTLLGHIGMAGAAAPAIERLEPKAAPRATIALVGGTFINDALLKRRDILKRAFTIKTAAGLSPTIWYAETDGVPFYYVHMHGDGRYVETWAALRLLGVRNAIGGATAGGAR